MSKDLKIGEKVEFHLGTTTATGIIKERITEDQQIGDRIVHAKEDNPKYVIEEDKTGREVIRNANKLHDTGVKSTGGQTGMS